MQKKIPHLKEKCIVSVRACFFVVDVFSLFFCFFQKPNEHTATCSFPRPKAFRINISLRQFQSAPIYIMWSVFFMFVYNGRIPEIGGIGSKTSPLFQRATVVSLPQRVRFPLPFSFFDSFFLFFPVFLFASIPWLSLDSTDLSKVCMCVFVWLRVCVCVCEWCYASICIR